MADLRKFAKDAVERAVKTVAQTAVITIGAGPVTGIVGLDWVAVGSISGLAGLLSLLTSVASMRLSGDPDSASLVGKHAA
jgi:hypothetical protein